MHTLYPSTHVIRPPRPNPSPSKHTPGVSATALANGYYYHTCVLVTGGGVKCWGQNDNGQLGIGNTVQQNSPVDVSLRTGGLERACARGA